MVGPADRARRALDMHSRGRPEAAAAATRLELPLAVCAGVVAVRRSNSSQGGITAECNTGRPVGLRAGGRPPPALVPYLVKSLALLMPELPDAPPSTPAALVAVPISRRSLRLGLALGMAAVTGAGLAAEILQAALHLRGDRGLVPMFSLSYEQNIPTWYSSSLLLACSVLLFLIAAATKREGGPRVNHWRALGLGFLYISLDEVASIHEHAGWLRLGGVLYFSWVIPAAIVVALVGASYLRFLQHLPPATRARFLLAGAIYVGGAVGMELPLGYWTERYGSNNFVYGAIDWVEESMEILGVTLFLLALVDYLGARRACLAFPAPPAGPAPGPGAEGSP